MPTTRAVLSIATVLACAYPAAAFPIVPREILKSYFLTGEVPTQDQFFNMTSPSGDPDAAHPPDFSFAHATLSSPVVIWRDLGDGGFLSDGAGHAQFLTEGQTLGPTSGQFATLIDSTANLIDDRYLIGLRFMRPDGLHYGYLDVSFAYPGVTIHGWAYESDPNTPITAHFIPTPTAAALLGLSAMSLTTRRRTA